MVESRNKEAKEATAGQQFSLKDAEAIRQCLSYLEVEASRIGVDLTAHIIGVASETVSETIARAQVVEKAPYANGKARSASGSHENGQIFERRSKLIKLNGTKIRRPNGVKG